MSCRKLEKFEAGKRSRKALERHARRCPECAEALRFDDLILARAAALRKPIQAPGLWDRIERVLEEQAVREARSAAVPETAPSAIRRPRFFAGRFLRPLPAAALGAGILLLGAGGYFLANARTPSSGILGDRVLARVERAEVEYVDAIAALASRSKPKFESLDVEIALLYRERLAAIDAQIARCRETLLRNPANARIHTYLMAALKDKQTTLLEVLGFEKDRG